MTTLTCPNCGATLREQMRYCPECGTQQAAADSPTVSYAPASPTPRRNTLWWILGGLGCLSLLLIGACAALLAFIAINPPIGEPPAPPVVTWTERGAEFPAATATDGQDVLLRDDFDDPEASGLGEDEDAISRFSYVDGAYLIEVKAPETIVWASVDGSYADARIEIDATVDPEAEASAAGLIFHYQDEDNFYLFSISNDGYYALELLEDNQWIALIDWTPTDAVSPRRNRLRLEIRGERIALYVNDELLEATVDGTFSSGMVAIAVSSFAESAAAVRFDNLVITRVE